MEDGQIELQLKLQACEDEEEAEKVLDEIALLERSADIVEEIEHLRMKMVKLDKERVSVQKEFPKNEAIIKEIRQNIAEVKMRKAELKDETAQYKNTLDSIKEERSGKKDGMKQLVQDKKKRRIELENEKIIGFESD